MEELKRVKFNTDKNEFYGDYGEGYVQISEKECYRFVNLGRKGVKCLGGENGYAVYGYR